MGIILFHRKQRDGQFSIENVFKVIRLNVKSSLRITIDKSRFFSNGLINRALIVFEVFLKRGSLIHISGDITFANLLLKQSIVTFHDFEFIHRAKGLKRFILKWFWVILPAKKATKITVISKATREALFNLVSVPEEKVKLIYNPITTGTEGVPLKDLKFPTCSFVFCIGTKKNKNLEAVIEICQQNHKNLVVLGALTEVQLKLISNPAIFQNFEDLDESHLIYLYQQAAMLCFCSFEEGFGLPIVEAQYLRCPVITSNCSSMPEVAGEGALFVDPYAKKEIEEAIDRLFSNDTLRSQLVEKGYQNAKRFAPKTIAEQYIKLYEEVLEEQN